MISSRCNLLTADVTVLVAEAFVLSANVSLGGVLDVERETLAFFLD